MKLEKNPLRVDLFFVNIDHLYNINNILRLYFLWEEHFPNNLQNICIVKLKILKSVSFQSFHSHFTSLGVWIFWECHMGRRKVSWALRITHSWKTCFLRPCIEMCKQFQFSTYKCSSLLPSWSLNSNLNSHLFWPRFPYWNLCDDVLSFFLSLH